MQGTARIIPACLAMGQAAGVAAVMSIRRKVPVGKVDVKALRAKLVKQGAKVE